MLNLVCDVTTYKKPVVCTLHNMFMHLSLTLFIYYLLIYFFIKHGVLQDYKAQLEPMGKDSHAMIREMLCEFLVKVVIPPDSRFHYLCLETVIT